jgi:hypothetical protein
MSYTPINPNGQNTMANSSPVVFASDQSNLPTTTNGTVFFFSTVNSSTADLAASAIFTGTVESIVNQQSYSILFYSSQNAIITVNQFIDSGGTKNIQQLTFTYTAGSKFARSGVANGNYFQVIIQNTGLSTTSGLRLDTAYGTIPSATQLNNTPAAINEINGTVVSTNLGRSDLGTQRIASAGQNLFRTTFASTLTTTWDTTFWTRISQGSGQVNSQANGNGLITTGTTINSDCILRSTQSFTGSFLLKAQIVLSQRIVNQNFFVELVDVIGDGLTTVINSATSVTVTIPNNPFTSVNIGQSMYMGAYNGTGTFIPSRYAILSVSGNDVTFTVASFSAGVGTCSLFGWNYHQITYNAAVATTAQYDTQRRGWNSGNTAITTLTTAAPGHLIITGSEDGNAFVADQLVASATTNPYLVRGSRVINIAEETVPLFIQIRSVNGTSAPASTTTLTVGTISMENYMSQQVTVSNSKNQSANSLLPVKLEAGTNAIGALVANQTINIAQVGGTNTVNGGLVGTLGVGGGAAHSTTATYNPVQTGGRVVPTTIATTDVTLIAADISYLPISSGLQSIIKPFSTSELEYVYGISSIGTVVTLQQLVPASTQASVRNYVTSIIYQSDVLGTAGNCLLLDGQGAIGTSVTIATPGVFTSATHELKVGDAIIFTSIGTITGITVNTIYYITATSFAATTFTVATTLGGTAIQITGSTSAFTFYRVFHQMRLQTTALATPAQINFINPAKGIANSAVNLLIPTSLTTGSIYVTVTGYRGF